MGSKYKSPLIRSRNASAASTPDAAATQQPAAPSPAANATNAELGDILVYDNTPRTFSGPRHCRGRGFSSPRPGGPRPRGSPYQWTPPNRFNNSWTPDRNDSSRYTSPNEQSSNSPYRPQFNKYTKRNSNNYSSWSNEKSTDESYFHPSMLEDPWASLLNNSENAESNTVF